MNIVHHRGRDTNATVLFEVVGEMGAFLKMLGWSYWMLRCGDGDWRRNHPFRWREMFLFSLEYIRFQAPYKSACMKCTILCRFQDWKCNLDVSCVVGGASHVGQLGSRHRWTRSGLTIISADPLLGSPVTHGNTHFLWPLTRIGVRSSVEKD